VVRWH
jgi:hypothetical protein